jgi:HEAT repeat protein
MAVSLPRELRTALESEEAGELDEIIRAHRKAHFDSLRKLVSTAPEVPPQYRSKALYALGRWGDPGVIPDIERSLPDLEETGRIAALDALGRLGTDQALEIVAQYAGDPSPQVRKFAIQALDRIGGSKARTQLRVIAREDPEAWIRGLAARNLEKR